MPHIPGHRDPRELIRELRNNEQTTRGSGARELLANLRAGTASSVRSEDVPRAQRSPAQQRSVEANALRNQPVVDPTEGLGFQVPTIDSDRFQAPGLGGVSRFSTSVATNLLELARVESGRFDNLLRKVGLREGPSLSPAEFEDFKRGVQTESEGFSGALAEIVTGIPFGGATAPSVTQEEIVSNPLIAASGAIPAGASVVSNVQRALQRVRPGATAIRSSFTQLTRQPTRSEGNIALSSIRAQIQAQRPGGRSFENFIGNPDIPTMQIPGRNFTIQELRDAGGGIRGRGFTGDAIRQRNQSISVADATEFSEKELSDQLRAVRQRLETEGPGSLLDDAGMDNVEDFIIQVTDIDDPRSIPFQSLLDKITEASESASRRAIRAAQRRDELRFDAEADAIERGLASIGRSAPETIPSGPRQVRQVPVGQQPTPLDVNVTSLVPPRDPRTPLLPLLRQSAKNLRLQGNSDKAINAQKTRLGIIAQNATTSARQKAGAFFSRRAGELPRERLDLEKNNFFSANDRELLHNTIFQDINSKTDPFFGPNTSRALDKIFDGVTPQRAELRALNQVFGDELTAKLLSTGLRRFGNNLVDIANIPRAIVTSFDMSAPLRQGLVLLPGHPKRFGESFFDMGKAFFNEGSARRVERAIESHENFRDLTQAGLAYTRRRGPGISLSQREEAFATSFVEKLGQSDNRLLRLFTLPIRASERAYTTFLNKLRFDVANDQLVKWKNLDLDADEIAARTEQWVRFVNRATGRGGLKGLESSAGALNAAFFSPRLFASRITLPLSLFEESPEIRKLVAKDLALFAGMVATTLTILNMNDDVDVEPNPESSDFGRIKIGPTRVDIMAGFQPIVRYTTQLISNERKSTSTGNFSDLNRLETIGRFTRSKLSPALSFIVDELAGEDFLGEEVNPRSHLERIIPFIITDIQEAVRENGLLGGAVASSAFFGTGVVSYATPDDASKTMFNDTPFSELPDPFMQDMARELYKVSRTKPQSGVFAELDKLDLQQQEALNKISQRIHPSTGRRINRQEAVRLYFDTQGSFANTRAGIFRGAFGARDDGELGLIDRGQQELRASNISGHIDDFRALGFAKSIDDSLVAAAGNLGPAAQFAQSQINLFKGGGDSANEQALDEYYEAQQEASGETGGKTTGTFDSKLWNSLLSRLESGWTKDQRIYVAANTHRRDVPQRLLIMLPARTQRRIRNSMRARQIRLKEFKQGNSTNDTPASTRREALQALVDAARSGG